MRLAKESGWLQIEQKTEPDPLEMVANRLYDGFGHDGGADDEGAPNGEQHVPNGELLKEGEEENDVILVPDIDEADFS